MRQNHPMKQKIRWGVIGSGGIAKRRTIPEGILNANNAELAVVCSRDAKKNEETAKQFSAKAACTIEELLKADIEAVYIGTPVHQHLEQTRLAAAAGKHVFCEKPLGLTVAEAEAMITACRKAKVNLGTAFMMRYHSQHQAAKKLIVEGKLGKPVFARAQISFWYPPIPGAWRQNPAEGGGGALIDLAGHCLDLFEMFFGPITGVSCMVNRTIQDYASEDSGVILARFANGALATVDTFFCIPDNGSKNRLELYGSQGSILAQGTISQGAAGEMTAFLEGVGETKIAPAPVNMYRAEIEDFSQALLDGRDTTESAQAGLRSQKLLAACYESAHNGREISVSVA
jgi:predicted dehydrogenase